MPRMLISFYSRTSHTRNMANEIAKGASEIGGVDVDIKPITDVDPKELTEYDAFILGSPTYYGTMSAECKQFLDDTVVFHGQLAEKVGGAFASSANIGGGNETTIMDILKALLIHGMVITGAAHGDHYGPVAIGDTDDRSTSQCREYGRMLAELTVKLHG